MRRTHDLDSKDRAILALLEVDARRSNSDIARLTGLSAPTVAERIARLRDIGVIRRFSVEIDPDKIDLPIAALVRFQPRSARDVDFIDKLISDPAIRTCHRVTGSSLLELTVRLASREELKQLLERLRQLGETETALILSTDFENRPYFADERNGFEFKE